MHTILLRFPAKRKFTCPEHFDTAYKKYADSMYGLLLKSTNGNEQQAEMLLCETFTALFYDIYKQPSTTVVGFMQIFSILLRTLKTNELLLAPLTHNTLESGYTGA